MIFDPMPSLPTPIDPMLPMLYRIEQTHLETHDTFTLELVPIQNHKPFRFVPGQFNMLYAFGTGECAISVSSNPTELDTLCHTIRRVGNVTTALSKLRSGDTIGIRGPFGRGWDLPTTVGHDVVLVAGGIGLAPLRPAIEAVLADRTHYGKIVILIGTRTPQDLLFRHDLERWRSQINTEVWVTVDRAESDWQGHVGVVTNLIRRADFDRQNAIAMICGPEIMMQFTIMELLKQGMNPDEIYLTMERNMKCAIGFCGHCQLGPTFICKGGPVFRYDQIKFWFDQREF